MSLINIKVQDQYIRAAVTSYEAMSCLTWLVTSLTSQRHGFDPRQVHVGYLVDKLALKQVFIQTLWFPQSVSFHQYSILIHSSTTDTVAKNLSLLGVTK